MAQTFTHDQIQAFKANFALFDKSGDGKITHEEVGVVMRSLGVQISVKDLSDMLKEIDTEGSGWVDFPQFPAMMSQTYKEPHNEEDEGLKEAFKVFDREGLGYISTQDLRAAMVSLGESLSAEEVDRMIKDADSQCDGFVNYSEFVQVLCRR